MNSEETIHTLWIGKKLSALEMLTVHSFLDKGHSVCLWLYDEIENKLPAGVVLGDASQIVPRKEVFSYRYRNSYGHGKGSYAGFSDIFRYKLLYERGGWWVDMDVTCLKPLNFDAPYVFRNHHQLRVVGNVMKCPKNSELMKICYQEAVVQVTQHNTDWHKPIDILNQNIENLRLENYIVPDISNPDLWDETQKYFLGEASAPPHWYFIHWQNEELRARNISKDAFYYRAAVAKLAAHFGLFDMPAGNWQKLLSTVQHSEFIRILVP